MRGCSERGGVCVGGVGCAAQGMVYEPAAMCSHVIFFHLCARVPDHLPLTHSTHPHLHNPTLTADALLAGKSHRELLQPYDTRAAAALSYLTAVRPSLAVEAGPLSDPKVCVRGCVRVGGGQGSADEATEHVPQRPRTVHQASSCALRMHVNARAAAKQRSPAAPHSHMHSPSSTNTSTLLLLLPSQHPPTSHPLLNPQAPTLAELDPAMEALVVSVETLPGATAINKGRAARGFAPLSIITVPVIGVRQRAGAGTGGGGGAGGGGGDGEVVGEKLSSSGLRAAEATLASASMDEGAVPGAVGAAAGVTS